MGDDTEKVKYLMTVEEYEEAKKVPKLIIDFTAAWCPPCGRISKYFAELANQFPDITFRKVDVDDNREVAQDKENITGMPTFRFYYNGTSVISITGADKENLKTNTQKLNDWTE